MINCEFDFAIFRVSQTNIFSKMDLPILTHAKPSYTCVLKEVNIKKIIRGKNGRGEKIFFDYFFFVQAFLSDVNLNYHYSIIISQPNFFLFVSDTSSML